MEDIPSNTQVHEYPLRIVWVVLLLLSTNLNFGQAQLSTSNKKAAKFYTKADKKYQERDFETAILLLQEATRLDSTFYEAYLKKGSLYNVLGQEDSVYSNFASYATHASLPAASILERLALMAFDRGEYLRAKAYLISFLDQVPEKTHDPEINLLNKSIQFALVQVKKPIDIKIEALPQEINKFELQYLPAMTVDGNTLVYTVRERFSSDENIVISYKEHNKWRPASSISPNINSPLNEGAATISADGRTMIFTSCDRRDSFGSCDLYISRRLGDRWTRPKNLGKQVNSKYWESQPSLSADGRTLFFSSNRPGGFGRRDLWVCYFESGQWSLPQNLGATVNSFKDETTPYIHFNGQTLFFSSNSYVGMGGFDLYQVEREDTTWTQPQNLGYPVNTFRDEVALLISPDGASGYFAKEVQKNREILDSRIVSFSTPASFKPEASYFLTGKVTDESTGNPLKAALQIVDINTNEVVYNNYSDSITGDYYLVLPPEKSMAAYIKRKGYFYQEFSFTSNSENAISSDTVDISLIPVQVGKSLILENIYFDVDSYELDQRSESELSNVTELLKDNSFISIEIGGHTDDTGTIAYNEELSLKRAKAVYDALVARGIKGNRITYKGYGNSRPLKPNISEINRQSNRRIEFRVIRKTR